MFLAECRRRAETTPKPCPKIAADLVSEVSALPVDDPLRKSMDVWLATKARVMVEREMQRWKPKRPDPAGKSGVNQSPVRKFLGAATTNDLDALADYRLSLVVDATTRLEKPLGELTARDHRSVACSMQAIGERSLLLASVHRQVATLIDRSGPGATTADVIPPEKYRALLVRLAPALAAP